MQHKWSARMGAVGFIASLATLVLMSAPVAAEPFFIDGLESGDFNAGTNGFRWGSPNRTSIVRDDGYVINNGSPIKIGPLPERQWENGPSSPGHHAMRFRYPAGVSQAEQRFGLGGAYPELWASWWLRVPLNFKHLPRAGSDNQKLFNFWMDAYSNKGDGSTAGMEFRPEPNNVGGSRFYLKFSSGRYQHTGGDTDSAPFIRFPDDQGRWMQLVVHLKAESAPDSGNGVMQVWRRWENERDFTKTHDRTDLPIRMPSGSPKGFTEGYLMGWANSTYDTDTEFLMDNFTVSATTLLNAAAPTASPPKPPTDVRTQ